MFFEYIKHLLLFYYIFEYGRVLFVGNTQQEAVVIFHDVKQLDKACAGEQIAVIVVHRISQCIVIGIYGAGCFQQFHFVVHAPFAEYAYGFGGMTFGAAEWNIFRYDFLHPSFYGRYVFQLNGTPDAEIAEIAFGYGMLHKQFSVRKQFIDSLVQDKAKRTDICTHTGRIPYIQKFNIFIVVDPEIESFRTVIYFGADYLIGKIKIKTVINIQK
ncbi:hypothetical protein BACEGG_03027 [Bacteroides eggerthii DSM 20697]|nr:hypothetical protein BACEGG_03027 [Bacteroides eggerthii DSM 20697]